MDTVEALFAAEQIPDDLDDLDVQRAFAGFRHAVLGQPQQRVTLLRYELLGTLGAGGTGVVYEAFDPQLERPVAIKLLRPDRDDPEAHARLVREGKTLARLSHPNIVQVHDVGYRVHDNGTREVFIVMELVPGQTLAERLRGCEGWRTRLQWLLQAGRGLEAAHALGLVHRDFKPSNVVVDDHDRVRVLDFGLACEASLDHDETDNDHATALTRTGTIRGTPAYMAPEQHRGEVGDARSDQFAFGVALYEALHGARPYEGDTLTALHQAKRAGPPHRPRRGLPGYVHRALRRALAPHPEDRFASMTELLHALDVARHRRRRTLAVTTLGAVVLAGGLVGGPRLQQAMECSEAATSMETLWDERARTRVRAQLGDAEAVRVEARIDEYVARWLEARAQTCEDEHDQTRRIEPRVATACLDRSRSAVAATLTLLQSDPDAQLATRAIDLLDGLPDPTECRDPEVLQREPPPPEDEPTRREVDALRRSLTEATMLRYAAHYQPAWSRVEAAAAAAEALGYEPLLAEVEFSRGMLLSDEGVRLPEAEARLEGAYLRAQRAGHRTVAADAAVELVYVVGNRIGRTAEGQQWAKLAQAVVDADDLPRQVRLDSNRAAVLSRSAVGDYETAHQLLRDAVARVRTEAPTRRKLLGMLLHNLAGILGRKGEFEDAVPLIEEAIQTKTEHYGPHHPRVGWSYLIKGALLSHLDELRGAEQATIAGLRATDGLVGEPGLRTSLQENLAGLLIKQHRWDEAREAYARRFAIAQSEPEITDDRTQRARTLAMQARVFLHFGELDRARRNLDEAEALAEASDRGLALIVALRGMLAGRHGDTAAQLRLLEEALDGAGAPGSTFRGLLPQVRVLLVEARLAAGLDARVLAEQAVADYESQTFGPDNRMGREYRARAWWGLARTLADEDPARAQALVDLASRELADLSMDRGAG